MGIFSRKKNKENEEREPVKELDRSDYVKTAPIKKKTTSKTKEGRTMAAEKKETKTAAKKTAEKEPAKKTATKATATKKETADKKTEDKAAAKKTATKTEKPEAEKKAPAKKAAVKDTKTWHITKNAEMNKWQVKATENERVTKYFNTKAEAEEYVKTLLSNNEGSKVVTHKKDGKFQKK